MKRSSLRRRIRGVWALICLFILSVIVEHESSPPLQESQGGGSGIYYSPGRVTSATAVTLPSSQYFLETVTLEGGTTPGALQISYRGAATAVFMSPSNGTNGFVQYNVNWNPEGSVLVAQVTVSGGLAAYTLNFRKGSANGPPIEYYRALYFSAAPGGATANQTAFTAATFVGGENFPKTFVAYVSAGNAQVWCIASDGGQQEYDAIPTQFELPRRACNRVEANNTYTPLYTGSAAQTIAAAFFY
jgi:hypothetical protein